MGLSASRALKTVGALLVAGGILLLSPAARDDGWQNASFPGNTMGTTKEEPDYKGWATILLGFFVWGSGHYFKLREAQRADRAEAREVADRRRRGDDIQ